MARNTIALRSDNAAITAQLVPALHYKAIAKALSSQAAAQLVRVQQALSDCLAEDGLRGFSVGRDRMPFQEYDFQKNGVRIKFFVKRDLTPVLLDFTIDPDEDGGLHTGLGCALRSRIGSFAFSVPDAIAARCLQRPTIVTVNDQRLSIGISSWTIDRRLSREAMSASRNAYLRLMLTCCLDRPADANLPLHLQYAQSLRREGLLTRELFQYVLFGDAVSAIALHRDLISAGEEIASEWALSIARTLFGTLIASHDLADFDLTRRLVGNNSLPSPVLRTLAFADVARALLRYDGPDDEFVPIAVSKNISRRLAVFVQTGHDVVAEWSIVEGTRYWECTRGIANGPSTSNSGPATTRLELLRPTASDGRRVPRSLAIASLLSTLAGLMEIA